MAKELPYFRFTAQEWQNGDISLESYELKGLFVDICAFYWIRDCSVAIAVLEKRFSDATALLKQLLSTGIVKVNNDDFIEIDFLNEQYDSLSEERKKRVEAGRIGGLRKSSNARASLQHPSSYKDKDKDKDKDKELYSEHFDKFWNLYDKKIDRAKCEAKFSRLKKDEVESILKTLPNYVKANPEIKYRKNPLTYLNGKCWMDEIIITGSNNSVEKSQSPPNQYTPFETNGFLFDDYEIPMKDFLYQLPKVLKEDCLSGKYPKK